MEILALFLSAVILVLLIVVLVKSSKTKELSKEVTVMSTRLDELNKSNVFLYQTVDKRLGEIRDDNNRQLSEMRSTVDEKLQKTLESRISTTFKSVSDQLESVYKQLGEMQNLSKGVGNLEKVLTNVKTRGMWGELQAERILQDILLPEQYEKNVVTKHDSHDPVEFAVKLPGRDSKDTVFLPIDSKFPRDDYERLCDATRECNEEEIKVLRTSLERRILSEAKDIRDKYIDVPHTTDFGVMFLPVEGLYAEVLSISGLQERLQREFHVMVAGPATLASLLNSLQMGFRTLAIEKKSAQVWQVLGEVKTESAKFGNTLDKVQERLNSASKEIEEAFVRQRAMNRKLRSVDSPEANVIESDSESL